MCFANAHRLFRVANISRLIRENRSSVENVMKSVCFESNTRERDLVNGIYGTLRYFQREAERLEENRTAWSAFFGVLQVLQSITHMHCLLRSPLQRQRQRCKTTMFIICCSSIYNSNNCITCRCPSSRCLL
ncbi:protein MpASLBD1 [Marchantia polymorpha subsp. ruderalis]|uniref:LOB domain-containing protein n=2 Tax=Marchantia polymorpha TaxID=3197 RepID=A0AAF6B1D4_MARPO|nr:hypothetical protein MARPO_0004s0047 [Marchantia polymorpha]BBN05818.1 hypothetical protein Mp_3g16240 [Marchantia polymorpha subsp. ruderalis]|eukprot:PTQ48759.1 hypothetical protein MARPO_0004s0047 [Marchantia polymorpha]